jgi:hypothetical protein
MPQLVEVQNPGEATQVPAGPVEAALGSDYGGDRASDARR